MKEFVKKLIGRLEEQQAEAENEMHRLRSGDYVLPCSYDITDIKEIASESFKESIEIVNELAEEFATDINVVSNNGWIPCSERLPEKEVDVLVCFLNDMDCVIAYRTKMMNTNLKDVWVNSSTAQIISSNIIAWQPLPQPFKEEGASNE